jgi:hexosaminidase
MQSPEFIKQLIDWMALQKLNVLHWHLTDDQGWRLQIKRYPKLTEVGAWRVIASNRDKIDPKTGKPPLYGGFYTQAEVRDIVAYAAARNITIVPEIEMPGHATAAIAAYPELGSAPDTPRTPASRYGIFPNLYNVNDSTFTFLENVLTEVMELFPSTYIHVGGDEAIKDQWKASPAIQAQMKEKGVATEDELQSYFIKRIDKFLTEHHRRTIGWDEILEGGIAPDAAVMSWRGLNGGIEAAKSGHDAVLTPTRPLYFNYRQGDGPNEGTGRWALNTLKDVYQFNPAPASLTENERKHIIGVQGSLWTEYVINPGRVEPMLFPRSAALAEMAWSPAQKQDWPGFLHRMDAELNRYRDLGIHFAPTVFEVRSTEQLNAAQNTVQVALANQTGFGQIHYTTDGSPVTNSSPTYTAPFVAPLPTLLRAGTFEDGKLLTNAITRPLNALSVRRKDSRELQLCSNDPAIQMEPDPPPPTNSPVFLVNYKKSCWIYKAADLTGITSISASVLHIPYVFQDRSTSKPPDLPTPHSPNGELEVHLDTCTGEPTAVLPLPTPTKSYDLTTLTAKIAKQSGKHDLCLFFTRKQPDPLWVLQWIQPTSTK